MTQPTQATIEAPASGGLIIFTVPRGIPAWAVRAGDQLATDALTRRAVGEMPRADRLVWRTVIGVDRARFVMTDAGVVELPDDVVIRERIEIDPWNPAAALSFGEAMVARLQERFGDPETVVDRDAATLMVHGAAALITGAVGAPGGRG